MNTIPENGTMTVNHGTRSFFVSTPIDESRLGLPSVADALRTLAKQLDGASYQGSIESDRYSGGPSYPITGPVQAVLINPEIRTIRDEFFNEQRFMTLNVVVQF